MLLLRLFISALLCSNFTKASIAELEPEEDELEDEEEEEVAEEEDISVCLLL